MATYSLAGHLAGIAGAARACQASLLRHGPFPHGELGLPHSVAAFGRWISSSDGWLLPERVFHETKAEGTLELALEVILLSDPDLRDGFLNSTSH